MTRGHILIEIILWLCFLIPGVIYSIWRHSTRYDVCGSCGASTLVPVGSPVARTFMKEQGIEPERPRPPSKAAYAAGQGLAKLFRKK